MTNHPLLNAGLGAAVALLLLAAPKAHSANLIFTANLSGAAESPPVASTGTGSTTVTYDSLARTLRVQVDFTDLVGNTTVAHIHAPTSVAGAGNVGVAVTPVTLPGFPVGVTAGSYNFTLDLTAGEVYTATFLGLYGGTAAGAEAGLVAAMSEGKAYLNVHTSFAPSGEIRGFLAQNVPEPGMGLASALAFLGLAGLPGLKALRRRTDA